MFKDRRAELAMQLNCLTLFHDEYGDDEFRNVPERVGEANECQRDDVVDHHDSRVLPPCVHVDRSINGVAVEAALDQVGYGDVCRH